MSYITKISQGANSRLKKTVIRILIIVLASVLMAANIRILVRTAGLFPGGAAGLTLLFQGIFEKFFHMDIPYSFVNLAINAIPVYIGFCHIGKRFTLYSCVMIFLTGFFTDILPPFPMTEDILLASIFGGIINGTAISLVLSVDATSGGTDFIGIYLSQKKNMDSFNLVLGINAVILTCAGILFGWDKALYSIIFQFSSTQVLNWLYRHYQKSTMLIITEHPDELYGIIKETTNHDATKFAGTGCYKGSPKTMLYTVVSTDEVTALTRALKKQDRDAFINVLRTQGIIGKFFTRVKD